ncbi:MAG: hypothetical protein Q4C13_02475, partial [Clostridia bacterium]|nr:hypothetical protein [Clostridia bacterium]
CPRCGRETDEAGEQGASAAAAARKKPAAERAVPPPPNSRVTCPECGKRFLAYLGNCPECGWDVFGE